MTALTYFTVAADYLAAIGDGLDTDTDPDITPVTATVTFTPLIESGGVFKAVTYTPRPTGFVPVPVVAKVGTDGRLAMRAGQTDVRLVAETAALGLASGSHLYYKATFSDVKVAGQRSSISEFTFQAATSDTVVNLISVTPAAGSQAVGITRVGPDAVRLNGSGQVVFSSNGVDIPDPLTLTVSGGGDGGGSGSSAWSDISGKPAVIAAGADQAAARAVIDAPSTGAVTSAVAGVSAQVTSVDSSIRSDFTTAIAGTEKSANKNQANGYLGLGSDGKASAAQLPAYVDDVLEFTNLAAFPSTGESGKIYTALDTNKIYRWSGSVYVVISDTLVIGTTGSTAKAGDYQPSAANISDSTAVGRSVITAADAAAARTAIGAGTASSKADVGLDKARNTSGLGVSIVDYGATTGAADNVAAIQAAINAASTAGGGTVYVPTGTFLTSAFALKSYVTLEGEGAHSSVLKLKNGANSSLCTLATVNEMWVGLRELTLDGNKANQTGTSNVVNWDNTGYATGSTLLDNDPNHFLHRVTILNGKGHGFCHTSPLGQMQVVKAFAYNNDGRGFSVTSPDNQWDHCIAAGNGLAGFYTAAGQNRGVGCKAFFNGIIDYTVGAGFYIDGGSNRSDWIHCEAQDNCGNGFALINVADCIIIGKAERNGLGPSPFTGYSGDGFFAVNVTNSRIDLNCTDRNVSGTRVQRWAYNLGSGNVGNVVTITCGQTASGIIGNGTWGANNVVTTVYNGGTPVVQVNNVDLTGRAPLASPTFTGTVSGITAAMVGLGNVNNTADTVKPVSTAQQTALNAKAPLDATMNDQTGTTFTPAVSDDGKVITLSNAAAVTVTIPQNTAAAIPIGSYIEFVQLGAGQVTFVAGTGASVYSRGGALKINGQYGVAALRKINTNGFVLTGDLTT